MFEVIRGDWKMYVEDDDTFYLGGTEAPNTQDFKHIKTLEDILSIQELMKIAHKRVTSNATPSG